jgi:hypothetical protein
MAMIFKPRGYRMWFTPRASQISPVLSSGVDEFAFATTKIWEGGKICSALSRVQPMMGAEP